VTPSAEYLLTDDSKEGSSEGVHRLVTNMTSDQIAMTTCVRLWRINILH